MRDEGITLRPLFGGRGDDASASSMPLLLAGPCSAESEEQVEATARDLAALGIRYFRAGIWKPRTRPGSFEGVGARGLKWLRKSASRHGMVPLTEVANAAHLRAALRAGIRNFWIGARTAANPFAVQELADVFASLPEEEKADISILVKNPVNPDLELWIGALQRLNAAGVQRLGAIHRGFGAYGETIYRNRPEWRLPIELKRRIPALPVICDPSHIAGRRGLVEQVARQAVAMDFDGLILECHCNPEAALSDKEQQLTPQELSQLLPTLSKRTGGEASAALKAFREEIDAIDAEIVVLLARRMAVADEIGELKRKEGIPVLQPERYCSLMERRVEEAEKLGLSPQFMRKVFSTIHDESVGRQINPSGNNEK
ncbi:MAG: bifunctional 3-deoxy-7-phosphoheptulonate synthase/chorismate mutase type II [Muribaculaceae bacterium]|nr:bifunctional 3-deoxy-7-phosphoheptulonate synthase/chorismate mutase type II [Muribaculaceae bacterium]